MERTKRISSQTLAIAILSLLLVVSMLMTATGAWWNDSGSHSDNETLTFGTIVLGAHGADITFTPDDEGGYLMPGDTFDIDFTVDNAGTAQMWVRFSLILTYGEDEELPLDTESAPDENWVYEDGWFYTAARLDGGDDLEVNFTWTLDSNFTRDVEGEDVVLALSIEAVQAANNGATALDADWA